MLGVRGRSGAPTAYVRMWRGGGKMRPASSSVRNSAGGLVPAPAMRNCQLGVDGLTVYRIKRRFIDKDWHDHSANNELRSAFCLEPELDQSAHGLRARGLILGCPILDRGDHFFRHPNR